MGSFSIWHWLVVAVVVLLLFGGKKLGDLGKGMGEGIRDFKKALNNGTEDTAKPPANQAKVQLPPELVGKSAEEVAAYYQAKERERAS